MNSILQRNTERCFFCHSRRFLEWHHVWGGCKAIRDRAGKYGLVVRLCHTCHNEPPDGVHQNRERRLKLQAYAQKKAMEQYGWSVEDFREKFRKNYLGD